MRRLRVPGGGGGIRRAILINCASSEPVSSIVRVRRFYLDNVAVNASRIPEPATVLLLGVALITGRLLRRRT